MTPSSWSLSVYPFGTRRTLVVLLTLVLGWATLGAAAPEAPQGTRQAAEAGTIEIDDQSPLLVDPKPEPLTPELARWLEEVTPLITGAERTMFMRLMRNHQREAFVEAFWRVRDPYPRTTRNELKERWPVRVAEARSRFETLDDDRARILLIHDSPTGSFAVRCTATQVPAEVWFYQGSPTVDVPFLLVFLQPDDSRPARVWRPGFDVGLRDQIRRFRPCVNGSRLAQIVSAVSADSESYAATLRRALAKPSPQSKEWIQTFVAQSTDLPIGAQTIEGTVGFAFLGRYQNRVVAQGLIEVPTTAIATAQFAGYASRDLQLTGEVLKDGSLFESFRYRFGFAVDDDPPPNTLPIAFQRYLRPGAYDVILRLDDLNGTGVFRVEQPLEVPSLETRFAEQLDQNPLTSTLFAEALSAIESGETQVKLIAPTGALLTGSVRFDAVVAGPEIQKLRFVLDDKPILTKNRPPFDVRIDLGPYPDLHTLRVEGLDAEGGEVASDEILINGGGHRFGVKLIEPSKGKRYTKSVRTRFDVEVPDGRSLDRVELFLNDNLVATLYQEPWVHPIMLPAQSDITYVRAVAYLPDGNSTEDVVFINAPDLQAAVDVQLVELYTTVLDQGGRPVAGLDRESFRVLEDGEKQSIDRFETVSDLPIHVGVLIDNSASMHGVLDDVRKAALSFFQQAIKPKDRAAVVTFNQFPHLATELTNDRAALGRGLAGLVAEGRTSLYDSVMFALYYFTGIRGQRAILVLSDGKDETSRFTFDETLEYARRAGITIYSIGLRLGESSARRQLARLADETGGRSFFIRDIAGLAEVYDVVQRELRSQYLITYQSSNTTDDKTFRTVALEVDRPSVTVKTLSGYYP